MSVAISRPRLRSLLLAAVAAITFAPATSTAATIPVSGVQTAVAPDAGLVQGLTSLGATVRLTGAATANPAGRFVFPVTGGGITADLKGRIGHTGGIQFRNRIGLRFGIQSFVIDTTGNPVLTAIPTLGGFSLGIRVPVASIEDITVGNEGEATIVGGTLKLTDIGALYINVFLGRQAVKRGTTFGLAEATVTLAPQG